MTEEEGNAIAAEMRRDPSAFRRTRRTGRPRYLRRERRPGWSASLPLYVLWCEDCREYSVSHPAGYGRIHCRRCRRYERVMTWQRLRDKNGIILVYAVALAIMVLSLLLGMR